MKTKYKHINFVCDDELYPHRLKKWKCRNNRTGDILAALEYYKPWRKFVIHFDSQSIFDETCLADIQHFLNQLNQHQSSVDKKADSC